MPGIVSCHFCLPSLAQQLLCLSPVAAREETGGSKDVIEAQGVSMNPYVVSAQFAAYVWYEHQNPEKSEQEAVFFARRNWVSFLPCVHKEVGKLLTKIAEPRMGRIRNGWSKGTKNARK